MSGALGPTEGAPARPRRFDSDARLFSSRLVLPSAVLYDLFNTARLTDNFTEKKKVILENQSALWAAAALMHVPAYFNGGHPKGLCLQNGASFPLISLITFLASRKC